MRAPPPLQCSIPSHGAWRWLVAALGGTASACAAAWAGRHGGMASSVLGVSALLAAAAGTLAAWRAAHRPACELHFDQTRWRLRRAGDAAAAEVTGQVSVVIDLGSWMLLCLRAGDGDAPGRRVHWLPVAERDLGPLWHALRCAACAPAAATADPAAHP